MGVHYSTLLSRILRTETSGARDATAQQEEKMNNVNLRHRE